MRRPPVRRGRGLRTGSGASPEVLNLLLVRDQEWQDDDTIAVTGDRARHLFEVLECRPGDDIRVGKPNGFLGRGRILAADRSEVRVACRFDAPPPPARRLELLMAVPRPKVLGRVVEQAVSLGVSRLHLLRAWFVEKSYLKCDLLNHPERMEERVWRGLEVSGRTHVPEVLIHPLFRPFVEDDLDRHLGKGGGRFLAHPGSETPLGRVPLPAEGVLALAIGPERGWTAFEVELLTAHGFQAVSLGDGVLRVETAAVAGLALLAAADASRS
ncbi:MAG TPA: 16S rRNA (uracil(1498)-N(3))-methyltransferase [Planctomycetes bacterium]|nr:16S rRNA (uracil(1498)-N(3))-methyltransferase [Planctomycetota bacterium]